MAAADRSIRIPLHRLTRLSSPRRGEPVTFGVPLPRGLATADADIALLAEGDREVPRQVRPLDLWPDSSFRWVLVDFLADADVDGADGYALVVKPRSDASGAAGLRVSTTAGKVTVDTGRAVFEFAAGGMFPFSNVTGPNVPAIDWQASGFRVGFIGQSIDFQIAEVAVHEAGPLRAEVEVRATPMPTVHGGALDVVARVEMFAGNATARLSTTIRNPRRAEHRRGHWELGDAGSLLLDWATLLIRATGGITGAACAPEPESPLADVALPFEIHQESSGGDHWNSRTHVSRSGKVELRFRGYRMRSESEEQTGLRASPVVVARASGRHLAVALPDFWQNFPRAIAADAETLEIGFFPRQAERLHELQGGEQKTHVVVIAFGGDAVSDSPLAWCHGPLVFAPPPDWVAESGAVPFLVPDADDARDDYRALVALALDPSSGFLKKREIADEYGWRHFGDLPADHESAFRPAGDPFVSHYNNQYDAIAGFAVHFLRTGDARWHRLMTDLARHVRDVDIYHTREDKAAYSGGLFWHTAHYVDAGRSTHRTYPAGTAGGGPSSEHNYNVGLMLHYFLTGERASRDAAVGLGQWVVDMDDGDKTVFRWLARGATGLASFTVDYYGPGRGAGHSILACLTAFRLSGEGKYLAKAEELIRRSAHPAEDIARLDLLNAERRWSYTAFLQGVGAYLHLEDERGRRGDMHDYARETLLHYARWMAEHERPYLDHPEQLEYPTETWAAQELRKTEVFLWAAWHAPEPERGRFLAEAERFYRYAMSTLSGMPTRVFTRPLVLVLTNGYRYGWFAPGRRRLPAVLPAAGAAWPPVGEFVPQKRRAMARAKLAVVVFVVSAAAALLSFLVL